MRPKGVARLADGEIANVDHLLYLAQALLQDLAAFERNEPAEMLLCLPQRFAKQTHELAAFGRRHLPPDGEGRNRIRDRPLDIGRFVHLQPADLASVDRRAHGEIALAKLLPIEAGVL